MTCYYVAAQTYVRDPSRLEPAGLRTKDQKQEWQVQLDRLMEDIRKGAAEYGPDTSVAYTCALNLKALTQDVQLILKAAAEDCSKTAAACSQPETTTVGSKVLAHCTDNLAVIVKAVNRHCSCNEQECHTKATSSAASKSMPASSQQQIGSAANSRKNELWWHDVSYCRSSYDVCFGTENMVQMLWCTATLPTDSQHTCMQHTCLYATAPSDCMCRYACTN